MDYHVVHESPIDYDRVHYTLRESNTGENHHGTEPAGIQRKPKPPRME